MCIGNRSSMENHLKGSLVSPPPYQWPPSTRNSAKPCHYQAQETHERGCSSAPQLIHISAANKGQDPASRGRSIAVNKSRCTLHTGRRDGWEQIQIKGLCNGQCRQEAPLRFPAASGHCSRRVERRRPAEGEGAARLCWASPGTWPAACLPAHPSPGMVMDHPFYFQTSSYLH